MYEKEQMMSYFPLFTSNRNNSDKQMKLFFLAYVFLLYGWTRGQELFPGKITLVDSTDIYLGDDNFGTIAAFGDYNGDGSPDLFIISDNGSYSLHWYPLCYKLLKAKDNHYFM